MLRQFNEKVEAAIQKLSSERDPRRNESKSGMKTYYSAGKFVGQEYIDEDGWWATEGGWQGHFN